MMTDPSDNADRQPFTAFNFAVEIHVGDKFPKVCSASFSECDGLEMTMEVKTIREGGNNIEQIRLPGPLNYSSLTLKRGMTSSFDLWDWFDAIAQDPTLRADADIVLLAQDGTTERARFRLTQCLPVKLKAPTLNAREGMVAVEEFQLSYQSLALVKP